MIIKILDIFKLPLVHAVGWCGGGAKLYHTIALYPERFAKRNIFHNVVIGEIPKNLELILS